MAKRTPKTGSPIETMLISELVAVAKSDCRLGDVALRDGGKIELRPNGGGDFFFDVGGDGLISDEICESANADCLILTGVRFLGYKLDILIVHAGGTMLGVECDGHDFHERTVQQASRDRARDRDMLKEGLSVVRFTGSDIHRVIDQCAIDCIEILAAIKARDECRRDLAYFMGRTHAQDEAKESSTKRSARLRAGWNEAAE